MGEKNPDRSTPMPQDADLERWSGAVQMDPEEVETLYGTGSSHQETDELQKAARGFRDAFEDGSGAGLRSGTCAVRGASTDGPDVSVVVPVHSRFQVLASCLDALNEQSLPPERYEVLLVANGVDEQRPQLDRVVQPRKEEWGDRLRVLDSGRASIPAARNCGIREARGRVILQINEDAALSRSALEQHLTWHQGQAFDPGVVIVGGRRFSEDYRRHLFNFLYEELGLYSKLHMPIPRFRAGYEWFVTCNLSCPRESYERFGYFDESFTWGSDTALGRQWVENHDVQLVVDTSIVSHHMHVLTFETWKKNTIKRTLPCCRFDGVDPHTLTPDHPYVEERRETVGSFDVEAFARDIEELECEFDGIRNYEGGTVMGRPVRNAIDLATVLNLPLLVYSYHLQYRELLRIAGGGTPESRAREIAAEAEAAYEAGDLASAHRLYTRATELAPRNTEMLNDLGTVCLARGDVNAGLTSMARAVCIDPDYELARRNLEQACKSCGLDVDRVLSLAGAEGEPVRADTAGPCEATGAEIEAAIREGDLKEAWNIAMEAAEAASDDPDAWSMVARVAWEMGRREDAAQAARTVLALASDDGPAEVAARRILAQYIAEFDCTGSATPALEDTVQTR
jgi:Flp pilus assembly protein TadD/GT2 family glycosyltransferase